MASNDFLLHKYFLGSILKCCTPVSLLCHILQRKSQFILKLKLFVSQLNSESGSLVISTERNKPRVTENYFGVEMFATIALPY